MKTKRQNKLYTLDERRMIESYLKRGFTSHSIAKMLDKSHSGIWAEIKKCGGSDFYTAEKAHQLAWEARHRAKPEITKTAFTPTINTVPSSQIKSIDTFMDKSIINRIEALEMQIEILHDTIKEIMK